MRVREAAYTGTEVPLPETDLYRVQVLPSGINLGNTFPTLRT